MPSATQPPPGSSPGELVVEDEVYDVIIVGAGPCGLAVAARLKEDAPAALFTDEEHRRYHWLQKYGKRVTVKHVKTGQVSTGVRYGPRSYRMAVLDESGDKWLSRWNRLFKTYGITHLRSPLLWHVDPRDRDSLLAHAHNRNIKGDLFDIGACVGKEISKHMKKKRSARRGGIQDSQPSIDINERDRNDYFTPSRELFAEHCRFVEDRYRLGSGLVRHEQLKDLDYGIVKGISVDDDPVFTITSDKVKRFAKVVVLAIGPANKPFIPSVPGTISSWTSSDPLPQTSHTFNLKEIPDPIVRQRIAAKRQTNVVVIGGGLTSAQVGDMAIHHGVTKVWHFMRGTVEVKYFDVGLRWMGKYKNREQARFWSADSDEERLEILKEARGGGSVTPHFNRILKKHVASGKVDLRIKTVLTKAEFIKTPPPSQGEALQGGFWRVETEPPIEGLPMMDYIYFATGIQTEVKDIPCLQTMMKKYPIQSFGGYPCVTEELMWKEDIPLFCAGRLGALRLGPAAPNIGGAKIGAERVVLAIEDVIAKMRREGDDEGGESGDETRKGDDWEFDYVCGVGSKYTCLDTESE